MSQEREERLREYAADVVAFETKLALITVPKEQRRNEEDIYNKMTLKVT